MSATTVTRAFLVGTGIGHSLSTAVHNAGAETLGLDWRYELLDIGRDELLDAFARLRADDCAGANVTMPFKADAAAIADERDLAVTRTGAANLLVNTGGRLLAENTDVQGMVTLLEPMRAQIAAGEAVVIGAGGAAAAALEALARVPPRAVTVLARREQAARQLVNVARDWIGVPIAAGPLHADADLPASTTLAINATALGMKPGDPSPLAASACREGLLVYDFVYARTGATRLQAGALEGGASVCDGAAHLLAQAGPTFERLTGNPAPAQALRAGLVDALGREPLEWATTTSTEETT